MNIQDNYNLNYNISMRGKGKALNGIKRFIKKAKQKGLDTFNEKTLNDTGNKSEWFKKFNEVISRPDINRLIMGATAIVTQPVIDHCNHRVDEETRRVSVLRTIAKIIVGTCVGIVVRGGCYRLVKALSNPEGKKKFSKLLIPKDNETRKWLLSDVNRFLTNHQNALSTFLAIFAMCYTNFKIDAPLTASLTNKLLAKSQAKEAKLNGKEGSND